MEEQSQVNKMKTTCVLALLPLFVVMTHSFSWDIVVAGEKRLEFYYNGTVTYTEDIPSAHDIRSITYDPVHYRVLFADHHNTWSIHSFDLTTKEMKTLVTRSTSSGYSSVAYDPVTELLFWSEYRNKNIYSLLLKPASSNVAVDGNLIATTDTYLLDIDVDSCGGYIYWVTDDNIERAAFDGSEREVLINEHVYYRQSLAIDQQTKTMYWIEETTYQQYCIKSADLRGENIQTFYLIGVEYYATALTVSKDFIYWKSRDQSAIFQLPKHHQHGVAPAVYTQSRRFCWWCQLTAANYLIEEQTLGNEPCEALKTFIPDVEEHQCSVCHNYCFQGNCTVSAEGHPECSCEAGYYGERCETNPCHMYCLNNGVCSVNEAEKPVCQCTADYEGEKCDVSICKEYCLQGNCSIGTERQRICRCTAGYTGERCEVNACHEHCLNNGDCSLNEEDEPFCQCTADYEDIVVAREKRLEFFYNGTVTYTEDIPFANTITSITYDPVHYRVLFGENVNNKLPIYSFDLKTKKMQTLVTRPTSPTYHNLAYDPVTQLLFWSEDNRIYSLSLKPASSIETVDGNLIATSDYLVGDIDVASCGGYIYWVTEYNVERAAFDGSEREVLINDHVHWRQSLAIDQQTKTMYWIEATTANHSIKSADLSGKNSRTFYFIGPEYYATALTVSKDFIYWKNYDRSAIFQLPKYQQHGVAPVVYSQLNYNCWPCQITAANYTIEEQTLGNESCEALKIIILDVEERHGSVCHNYCFQGNCTVSAEGHPKCSCEAGYFGERCHVNVCYKHCLHGGVCSLNEEDEPVCQCEADYEGERCDVATTQTGATSTTGACVCADQTTQQILQEVKQVRKDLQCTLQLYSDKLEENSDKIQICEQNHEETTSKTQTTSI